MYDACQTDPWLAFNPKVTKYLMFLDDYATDSSAHGEVAKVYC
jgi:hypothetical protein